ncbi:MAG: hypothetical protein M3R02_02585 [Chloroflexota bacterium]|nr:hypothetical protein [Chloroflexota bacterium]
MLQRVAINEQEATPVSSEGSPWAILPKGRFSIVSKLTQGKRGVQGRKGATVDLNGLYFVQVLDANCQMNRVLIETRPEAGRTDLGPRRRFWIEPDLLYPLIKGASDFSSCYFEPRQPLFVIVPNRGITMDAYRAAIEQMDRLPKTREYLSTFDALLRNRSTYKLRMKGGPFYSIYNVGSYTFAPFKLIWAEQSGTFEAAVASSADVPCVGSRPYVPDHKIFFVEFDAAEPAYYLCGLLNSPSVRELVESHNISIQVGNIFKHMSLPTFDAADPDHVTLSDWVKRAHQVFDQKDRQYYLQKIAGLAERILQK